jgi:hypothetical protein
MTIQLPFPQRYQPLGGWSTSPASTSCLFLFTRIIRISRRSQQSSPLDQHGKKCGRSQGKQLKQRADAKLTRPLEVVIDGATRTVTLGDVERDAKMAQVDGMRSVIEKNRIDSIERQISVMERLEKVYVKRMGRETYECQLLHLVNQLPGMLATGGNEGVEDGKEGVEGSEEGVKGAEGEME